MHRIDTSTAQKDKFGQGKNGFTRGNPQTGTPATQLDYSFFDAVQEEITGVIESAGFVLNKKQHNQLVTAINKIIDDKQSNAVKKSGDTMTGNLNISNGDSSAISLKNNKNDEWMLRIHADGSFSIFNKNSDGKWTSKFRNDSNVNVWRFENTSDVTIGGKSILKTGDYGIGSPTGTPSKNLDEHLSSGFYGTNTANIPNLPFTGGGSAASLLVLPSESPHWKVEQLSVVDGRKPKIYYRTDTKNDGKQPWYEVITTANTKEFVHPFMGDLGTKSLNILTGNSVGIYFQGRNILATAENLYPIAQAGTLNVMTNGADGDGCCQIYTTYRNARQFIRNYRGTAKTWEPWVEVITTANINQILPVGIPMPWPSVTPPDGWLICNGWKFDKSLYPGLAAAYPSGYLPEMRATTIRGLDAGRGIDVGRAILSEQGDAMRNLTGSFGFESNIGGNTGGADISGVFYSVPDPRKHVKGGTEDGNSLVKMDASRQVPTANEFRVRSIAFLYIVRAA